MRPLIGLTTSTVSAAESGSSARFSVMAVYCRAVAAAGGSPVLIPGLGDAEAAEVIQSHLDGILFTGGVDIHPRRMAKRCIQVVKWLTRKGTPRNSLWPNWQGTPLFRCLASAVESELINVAWGGTLVQDLGMQRPGSEDHRASTPEPPRTVHNLMINRGSRLATALGADHIPANSMHHQAVDLLAPGFEITARAEDGTVEAIEFSGSQFVMAVQCHPEHLYHNDERWLGFFAALVDEARRASERTLVLAR